MLRIASFLAILFESLAVKHTYSSKKDKLESLDVKFWFIEPQLIEKVSNKHFGIMYISFGLTLFFFVMLIGFLINFIVTAKRLNPQKLRANIWFICMNTFCYITMTSLTCYMTHYKTQGHTIDADHPL